MSDSKLKTPKWAVGGIIAATALVAASFLVPEDTKLALDKPGPNALDPTLGVEDLDTFAALQLKQQEDHPVTEDMKLVAQSMERQTAPTFNLISTDGTPHSLAELSKEKPLIIFFIEKECPCCLGAKHFFDKMADLYAGDVNAIGVINADGETAQNWVKTTRPKFAVLQDPDQKVIQAYKAERGVYTTLVAPGGTIDQSYPGYSGEMLQDLSDRIARLAGVEPKEFVSPAAPDEMTSGCLFPEFLKEDN